MPSEGKAPPSGSSRLPRTTADLTPAQGALLQILRDYQFGRIENMPVRAGQPLLGVGARLVRIARLDGGKRQTYIPGEEQFELKQEICRLFDELIRLQDCLVVRLEFRHGLPFQLETTPFVSVGGEPQDEVFRAATRGARTSSR
jgi:hypothetical protein